MGRILAIDYGQKRIGLAVSDETRTIATGLDTITYSQENVLFDKIVSILAAADFDLVVVGLPLRLDGGRSARQEEVEGFGSRLAGRVRIPVEYFDERFSTSIASDALAAQGKKPSRNKALVDKVSAIVILQGFLERNRCAP